MMASHNMVLARADHHDGVRQTMCARMPCPLDAVAVVGAIDADAKRYGMSGECNRSCPYTVLSLHAAWLVVAIQGNSFSSIWCVNKSTRPPAPALGLIGTYGKQSHACGDAHLVISRLRS